MSLRRTHKKSKLGCQECKRRHIKCDEAKPACSNCSNTERSCIYRPPLPRRSRSSSAPLSHVGVSDVNPSPSQTLLPPTPALSHITTPPTLPLSTASPALTVTSTHHDALHPAINMRHMELLATFILHTGPSCGDSTFTDSEIMHIMVPAALSAPYLMHQMLALAALHLSHKDPARAAFHHAEATTLQIQALTLFDEEMSTPDTQNPEAMLLFASFLSLHALGEAVITSQCNTEGFLDRFVSYLNLHRGVKAITEQCWENLLQSSLGSVFHRTTQNMDSAAAQPHERANTVEELLSCLLDQSDLSPTSTEACREAVRWLKLTYQIDGPADSTEIKQTGNLVWAWPILLSGAFTELLLKRQPEALIILCYYAVLLHQRRGMWLVGNSGRLLIESMAKFLGSYWSHWLKWPNEMIRDASGMRSA